MTGRLLFAVVLSTFARNGQVQSRVEAEPNDTPATANAIQLGDTVAGVSAQGEHDYFVLDIAAGTRLDIKASARGHNAQLRLIDRDGQTQLTNAYYDVFDTVAGPRIRFVVSTAGRYYLDMRTESPPGPTEYAIAVKSYVAPHPGPGDPSTSFAADLHGPLGIYGSIGMVAGASGDVYFTDEDDGRIARVSSAGVVTTFVNLDNTGSLAFDGSGDFLVPGCAERMAEIRSECRINQGVVWRVSLSGSVSRFAEGLDTPGAIEVAPDGDVWVGARHNSQLWHFNAAGIQVETIPVGQVVDMAFSPAGELHLTDGFTLWKLSSNRLVHLAQIGTGNIGSLAFDRDGYLYVSVHGFAADSRVALLDPQYRIVHDPFALVGDRFGASDVGPLMFARDASGAPTTRLLVMHRVSHSTPFAVYEEIAELNRAGVRAPGWLVGKQDGNTVTVPAADIANALMGGTALSAEAIRFLDSHGNHNGILDVGDLRAYLRAQGQLAGSRRP